MCRIVSYKYTVGRRNHTIVKKYCERDESIHGSILFRFYSPTEKIYLMKEKQWHLLLMMYS